MQKKYSYLMLAFLLSMLWLPMQLMAQVEGNTVTQLQFGKQIVNVATDQELTFYDPKGGQGISSSMSNNAQSLTVFKPAEAGQSIQITFERFDVRNDGSSWFGQAKIYSGEVDDSNFTWATTTNEVGASSTLPEGNVLETLDGTYTNKVYYSTASDGALSVGYLYRYAKKCDGWVAKVKCVKLDDMTITGAGSQFDNVVALPKSKNGVNFAGFYVTTTGVMNADHLKTVSFKLTKNESNAIDPLSLKLFAGNEASYKDATPIETTISENAGVYTFALDKTLESGKNQFTIVGDLIGNEVGSKVQLDVTGVTTDAHADGVTPFTMGESVAVEIPAVVTISATAQTVTIGDTPLNFFDDGGIDGQISKDLKSATITFKPSTEGKKIMVDFTKMSLATGTIYCQQLKIYNGSEPTADNLLKTILGTELSKVRSTAADGSLTVVFESNAYNTADGWEATVSQFVPQPMAVKGIAVTQNTDGTVCAGDTDQQILQIRIATEETEPVLTPKKFSFTTNNTNAAITKATLYYGKNTPTFTTNVKVGETVVTGDAFEITATNEVPFIEGDNYLWLTYDVNELATNDQKIDAAVTSITLSDGTHTVEAGNPEGDRKVYNVVLSHLDQGTVTKKVNGSIEFKTKNKNDYSSDYESGNDDRINIFEPLHEGMICQINFSKFDLYYNSYSSTEHASLKIYSGKGITGDLLWESTKETKTTGPGEVIRSTSADGALTVVFNSGVSSSWSTSTGFEATVSEYLSQPMAIESATATQASTQILQRGAKNQDILNVSVLTKGDSNKKNLSSVQLNMKGCQASVAAVKLYSVKELADVVATDAEPLATTSVTAQDETLTLTLDTPLELKEGSNNFRVQFDIADDAKPETAIDASLTSITADGETITATDGDPEGERLVKNIYNMVAGNNGEILITEGEPLMFYDDGGIDGSYTTNFSGTVTFAPKTPGQSVKLTFNDFALTAKDTIFIYDGGVEKEIADAKYTRYDHPTYFLSNSADGKVTVKFTSTYSSDGFAIEVTAYEKKPLHITSVTATSVAPESTLRGAEIELQKIAVNVEGDLDELNIEKFNLVGIDLADNAVSTLDIYATDTADSYSIANLYGSIAAGQLTAEGSYKITLPGTYYFWLSGNISADATIGATAAASVESIVANGETTAVADVELPTTTVRKGVSGTITVGAAADYGTIQSAIDALKGGIDGPVTINIKRGIYNENVKVPEIIGASAANTVTLQSESGDWHDVKIYYDRYDAPGYSDDQMAAAFGTFTIDGADWFTLRGVEVTTTDNSFTGVVHIKNQSCHVTIDSCYVHADMTTDYQNDINLIYTYSKNVANSNNDYLTVKNCLLEGGYIGVRMGGTGYVALPKEVGGVIENNVLRNQGTKAIYCMDELGAQIRGNVIENTLTTKDFYGFDGQLRDVSDKSVVIEGNKFKFTLSTAVYPISLREFQASADAPTIIANNEIIVNSDNSSSFGIRLNNKTSNLNIAYNTVNMNGSATSSAMYVNDENIENVNIVNNIFQNLAGGYAYRYYKASCVALPVYSHNVAYTTGSVFAYNKTDIVTYEDWKALTNEEGGLCEKADFYDDADVLEPSAAGNLLIAQPLSYVITDITGTERNAETPTIGAYEYSANDVAPVMADEFPTLSNITDTTVNVGVKFNQTGVVQFLAKDVSEVAPTAEDITLSETAVTAYKNKALTATVEGLEKDKEYVVYAVMTNLNGVASDVYATSKFVAGGEVIKEIPNVKVVAAATESVAQGEKAQFTATVSEGTAPFSISWLNGKRDEIATATLDDFGTASSEYAPSECDLYYVLVTDANGKQASDTCRVAVTGDAVTATFENLYLDSESFWTGPDTKGTIIAGTYGDETAGSFLSGSYEFSNSYLPAYASWSGFAYSNRTATDFSSYTPDQYNSAVGHGYDDSENFAVAYSTGTISVLNNRLEGDSIRGFYITNDAAAVQTIANGDSYAKKFAQGDYLRVVFTGTHADGTTAKLSYYLADYRSTKAADWYYLDTWQWVDLRELGKVTSISFAIEGSDSGAYGLNTPAYFCLDNFNGNRNVAQTDTQTADGETDLSQFFTFDDATATVAYAFADKLDSDLAENISLSQDGKLTVKKGYVNKFDVTVSATQRGKIQFVNIPFDIVSTINGAENIDGTGVAARYGIGGQKLSSRQRGVNIIRTNGGKTLKVGVK